MIKTDWRTISVTLGLGVLAMGMVLCAGTEPSARRLPVDLQGRAVNPLKAFQAQATVLVFIRTDCPICNRYAPVIQGLNKKYSPRDVAFWLVFPDPSETASSVRRYLSQYGYHCKALLDPGRTLVKLAGVRITPEAAVLSRDRTLLYHGRIDNWYVDFGKSRLAPTIHDLDNVIENALAGNPIAEKTAPAVGCYISDLE
jgi:hypothetical protein